jgi:DNA-binding NarL/FixJ family response regulator
MSNPTKRETEIAVLVAEGLSNKDIAKRLNIAEGTVKQHLCNVFRNVGMAFHRGVSDDQSQ